MPTFEITTYIRYRSTSLTSSSSSMSLAVMEGLDTDVRGGLRKGPHLFRLQSSAAGKGGIFFQHTRKMASWWGGYIKDRQILSCLRTFIVQLLYDCGMYPEPKSVIVTVIKSFALLSSKTLNYRATLLVTRWYHRRNPVSRMRLIMDMKATKTLVGGNWATPVEIANDQELYKPEAWSKQHLNRI